MIELVKSTANSYIRPLRRIVEVNSEFENSSANRVNTLGSGILSGPAGDESSGENQNSNKANSKANKSNANKVAQKSSVQAFEPAQIIFSPVTSDSGGDEKSPATFAYNNEEFNEHNMPVVEQHLELLTSETPCATEESTHIDIERIELFESTPRKKQNRKS